MLKKEHAILFVFFPLHFGVLDSLIDCAGVWFTFAAIKTATVPAAAAAAAAYDYTCM